MSRSRRQKVRGDREAVHGSGENEAPDFFSRIDVLRIRVMVAWEHTESDSITMIHRATGGANGFGNMY